MQILKLWNIRLLESIAHTQQHFSDAKPLTSSKHQSSKERRSFRTPKATHVDSEIKRAGSFSKMHTLGTGINVGALPGRRSWGGSNEIYPPSIPSAGSQLSQDSMFNSLTSPPPLPPRPEESESDSDDPDYAYIDENKVKGPENQRGRSRTTSSGGGGARVSSPSIDDQLEELKKSIMRENKRKKRDKAAEKKAATLHFPSSRSSPRARLPINFIRAEPEDYLEPVASKRLTSTSSEGVIKRDRDRLSPNVSENMSRSLSDHGANANTSSSSSIGTTGCEVFDDSQTPPDAHGGGGSSGITSGGPIGNPPVLPPRPWRNSSTSSLSSLTSPSSVTVPTLSSALVGNRTSISEEKSTLERVEERNDTSPILSSLKGSERTGQLPQATAVGTGAVVGNGRQAVPKDGSSSPRDVGSPSTSVSPPPPLPPRSPTRDRERLSRKSSSSSVSSNASSSRCPRCRSIKKSKTLVAKTTSLDQRGQPTVQPLSREESRKSLPDLNNASPFPENNLAHNVRQHHSHSASREHTHASSCSKCSIGSSSDGMHGGSGTAAASNGSIPSSSSQNLEYLQLLSEEGEKRTSQQQMNIDTDMSPALDLLSSCLQDLEYLENKVNQNAQPLSSNLPNQSKLTKAVTNPRNDQRKMAVQTDIDAAMKQTELVRAELSMTGRSGHSLSSSSIMDSSRRSVANGHPPLLKKRNTINSFKSLASSSGSPSPSSTVPSSSSGPLHWTQQPQPQAHTNGTVLRQSSSSSIVSTPTGSVTSPRSLQSPMSVFSPGGSGFPPVGSMDGGAPPVPPRSLVSLGEPQPRPPFHGQAMTHSFSPVPSNHTHPHQQKPLSKSKSLGRHMSSWKQSVYGGHPAPQRSTSTNGMSPGGMVGAPPPPMGFHNHMDTQQSATVFVHHLNRSNSRPRQLKAHLV